MKRLLRGLLLLSFFLFAVPLIILFILSVLSHDGNIISTIQYRRAFQDDDFVVGMLNSIFISGISLLIHIPTSFVCGLFLLRTSAWCKKICIFLLIVSLLTPFQVIMMPVYKIFLWLGVYDTYWAVILIASFSPLGILVMYSLLRNVPEDQWDAANLETSSLCKVLFFVVIPQLIPGIVALILVSFADFWNMVEQPLILLSSREIQPISMVFNDIMKSSSEYLFAGSMIYTLPVVLIYTVLWGIPQKRSRRQWHYLL